MKTLTAKAREGRSQDGINMVDLMMWLVIAALLLAAAIQGIGYYQKAAYLYQMQSDLEGAGTVAVGVAANKDGVVTKEVADEALIEAKRSAQVEAVVELASDGKTPYLRATHPGVTDKDALYLFDACNDTYKIGVNVVPKGGTAVLEACGITATPPSGGGGGTETGTPTPDDIDGDGTPNASDPDIDGDGTPNESDTTPNGDGSTGDTGDGSGGDVINVNAKCYDANSDTEATCWMNESVTAQLNYETANGTYFGSLRPGYSGTDKLFNAPELAELKSPLVFNAAQSAYRDEEYPEDNNNYAEHKLVARDGEIWQTTVLHYLEEPDAYVNGPQKMGQNVNYACKFVTPHDIYGDCTLIGQSGDKYRIKAADNDATADADIQKVINAQIAYFQTNGGNLYGGYATGVDVTSWAGTTNEAKIWNVQKDAWDQSHYLRTMVKSANGDYYIAETRFWNSDGDTSASSAMEAPFVYRYSATHVNDVCSRPFINQYNQTSDIGICSTLGYADFHP